MIKSKEIQVLEQQWEILKIELEQLEDFYDRTNSENEINVVHDIQNLIDKLETGKYFE